MANIAQSISLIHFELIETTKRSQLLAARQVALQISISIVSLTLGFCCFFGYSVSCHDLIQSGLLLLGNGLCVLSMAICLTKEQKDQKTPAKDEPRGTTSIRSATSTTRLVENDDIKLVDCPI